jgi:hypothetical protein
LLYDLIDLVSLEENSENKTEDKYINQHNNLRDKIYLEVKKEYNDLQDIYSKDFKDNKNKFYLPLYKKAFWLLFKILISITSLLYGTMIILSLLKWIDNSIPSSAKDNVFSYLTYFWVFIALFGSIILIYVFMYFIDNKLKKIKKYYYVGEYVSEEGDYYCRICNNKVTLYKNSLFPKCQQKHTTKQVLKHFFSTSTWAKCNRKYYKHQNISDISSTIIKS